MLVIYVLKTNSDGKIIWRLFYGSIIYAVEEIFGGGFIAAGIGSHQTKISASGGFVWQKSYDGIGVEFYDLKLTTDGGYIIVGNESGNTYLIKTDSNGEVL